MRVLQYLVSRWRRVSLLIYQKETMCFLKWHARRTQQKWKCERGEPHGQSQSSSLKTVSVCSSVWFNLASTELLWASRSRSSSWRSGTWGWVGLLPPRSLVPLIWSGISLEPCRDGKNKLGADVAASRGSCGVGLQGCFRPITEAPYKTAREAKLTLDFGWLEAGMF